MPKKSPKRPSKKITIDVIETQSIVLVDQYGKQRASLSCSGGDGGAGGYTVIHLNDDTGRTRLTLQVDDCGTPSICLFTPNNAPGISMAVNNGHGNGLSIANAEGSPCIELGVPGPESSDPRGPAPQLTVIDCHGRKVWSVFDGIHEIPERRHGTGTDVK